MDFNIWISNLRTVLLEEGNPLSLRNGRWECTDRKELWRVVASRIFDAHLDQIKLKCIEVFSEIDPQFEMEPGLRYSAGMSGKILKYSSELRRGLSETLALLNSEKVYLTNCSQHHADSLVSSVIYSVLHEADWRVWGSLNDVLPTLAEAAPEDFLSCVEEALINECSPFAKLFLEENNGVMHQNYMTGLLWALEALGWIEEHFMRVVLILAELGTIDPGGTSGNRPISSLKTMLIPWFPQTLAGVEKRIISVNAVKEEFPSVAWEVIKSLLPNHHQTSMGTYKPRWLARVPESTEVKVSNTQYRNQILAYAALAVDMSYNDPSRLIDLVSSLENLPRPSFDTLLELLSSASIKGLPEADRFPIWNSLNSFIIKHRRFSDAEWAMEESLVSAIEKVANEIAPKSPNILYRRLFSSRDFDLYEEKGDWERQRRNLEEKRVQAISEILTESGVEGIIKFLESVDSPNLVGWSLGVLESKEIDERLLPEFLDIEADREKRFIGSFIAARNHTLGSTWLETLDRQGWTTAQSRQFLIYLPFETETWNLVKLWLGEESKSYWESVPVNPYQVNDDSYAAIDNLLSISRPHAALECLSARLFRNQPFDSKRTSRALLEALNENPTGPVDSHNITELIKAMQNDDSTDLNELFKVEWAYLPLLGSLSEVKPKHLDAKLATEPDFFVELIRLIYRPKNRAKTTAPELSEPQKSIATNAWKLLHEWKTPPGTLADKSIDGLKLKSWMDRVKQLCKESGHQDVAMLKFGEVLYYCPADPNGLWIVTDVARILNARDADTIRRGFCTEVFNSRGAHWVDPTGAPERALATLWKERGEAVENAGFARFAASLRELSSSYNRQAERITERELDRQ